jgi:hypothetical protein
MQIGRILYIWISFSDFFWILISSWIIIEFYNCSLKADLYYTTFA